LESENPDGTIAIPGVFFYCLDYEFALTLKYLEDLDD
jgi:hypothetical protein